MTPPQTSCSRNGVPPHNHPNTRDKWGLVQSRYVYPGVYDKYEYKFHDQVQCITSHTYIGKHRLFMCRTQDRGKSFGTRAIRWAACPWGPCRCRPDALRRLQTLAREVARDLKAGGLREVFRNVMIFNFSMNFLVSKGFSRLANISKSR